MKALSEKVSIHEKLDAFRLQKILRSLGVLIPSDEIILLYSRVNKYYRTGISDGGSFSTTELSRYLEKSAGDGTYFMLRLIKMLLLDINLWIKSLFFWAGILLIINSFGTESIPLYIRRYLSLSVSVCYYINSGRYTLTYFYHEWRAQSHSEECTMCFKEALCQRALITGHSKTIHTYDRTMSQLLTYIKEQIYESNPTNVLTKRDFEMLLLGELGNSYTPRVLKDVISVIDKKKSGTISSAELHYFLASETPTRTHWLQRTCMVFWETITTPDWINTYCFFSGSVLQFFSTLSKILETDLSFFFGIVNPDLVVMILFIIGCNGFLRSEYEILRDEFDVEVRAKDILLTHVRFASHYSQSMSSDDRSLNKMTFIRLLEESNVHLSEGKLEKLFHDIGVSADGLLSSEEIEMFVPNEGKSKQRAILHKFLRSVSFWGNFTWLIGSYAYVISIYPPDEITGLISYGVGSFTYCLGGVCLCGIISECTAASLSCMIKLNNTLKNMIEDKSSAKDPTQTTPGSSKSFDENEFEQNPVDISVCSHSSATLNPSQVGVISNGPHRVQSASHSDLSSLEEGFEQITVSQRSRMSFASIFLENIKF